MARGSNGPARAKTVLVVLNQTPFYGESGGQVGDAGKLTSLKGFEADVQDTSKPLGKLHALRATVRKGSRQRWRNAGTIGRCRPPRRHPRQPQRDPFAACRASQCLGGHVTQKGSLVAPDRLRFDFSHPKALSPRRNCPRRSRCERRNPRQRDGHDPPDDPGRCGRCGRAGAVRREIWRRGPRAQHGPAVGQALFGRIVRRNPCRMPPATSPCSRSFRKAPCRRACDGSKL